MRLLTLLHPLLFADKSIIVWQLTRDDTSYGYPKKVRHPARLYFFWFLSLVRWALTSAADPPFSLLLPLIGPEGSQPLRLRRCYLVRRTVRSVFVLGPHPPSLGP